LIPAVGAQGRSHADLVRPLRHRSFGVYLMKIWNRRTVPRRSLIEYVWHDWWWNWLAPRAWGSVTRQSAFAPDLVWLELKGILEAPMAYRKTYRQLAIRGGNG
jgi:hypothetical protein